VESANSGPKVLEPTLANLIRFDGPAGTVVFLVALPLCLGIALASGAPLFSGVISGIVGGLVVGLLSGSNVSVSGPAAGLATIVAMSIQDLGSFPKFLLAVVLSGAFQIALGYVRAGVIGNFVPNPVIKGMLAAIGIVIILKQIPHALGRDLDFEGDEAFFEFSGANTFSDIGAAIASFGTGALWISLASLLTLLLWEHPVIQKHKWLRFLPGPLLVVALGIVTNELFRLGAPQWHLTADQHLVRLPVSANLGEFFQQFTSPDWSALSDRRVWFTAVTITLVGSIESLLSIEAADNIDPFKRITSTNRELKAQGVGNMVAGLLGGLPVTSVIVRTSANVYAGARTRWSAVLHGLLMLFAVLLVPGVLNKTPLAALAAILILIGYKLARWQLFQKMYRSGWEQFLPFVVTVLAIVFTDLLKGVLIGLAVGLFYVVKSNHHAALTVVSQDRYVLLRFNKDATFLIKSELKDRLRAVPAGAYLIIDATKAAYIDHDIEEVIEDFAKSAAFRNIEIEFKHFYKKLGSRNRRIEDGQLQEAAAGK
jgi:MFS superfamily sulfate permease-like transporter